MGSPTEGSRLFPDNLMEAIRDRFYCVDSDPHSGSRIYFENAGGSLTLKSVVEITKSVTELPDSFKRPGLAAQYMSELVEKGTEDVRLFLGAESGRVFSSQSASRVLFHITHAIVRNAPGTNVVTTQLDHPGSYDSAKYYAEIYDKEFRVAPIDPASGTINPTEILERIDKNTCLLSLIYASNLTGAVLDIKTIVNEARSINPDLFILVDATQYAPHAAINVEELGIDGTVFTTYKVFGKRGTGIGYVSERVSTMPHDRILDNPGNEWELGSIEPASYAAWTATIDYICWLGKHFAKSQTRRDCIVNGMNAIGSHERGLLERLLHGSTESPGLDDLQHVVVPYVQEDISKQNCLILLNIKGHDAKDLVTHYRHNGINVFNRSRESPMSRRILDGLGETSMVRVSPMHYNSTDEIDHFLKVTAEITE